MKGSNEKIVKKKITYIYTHDLLFYYLSCTHSLWEVSTAFILPWEYGPAGVSDVEKDK